MFKVHDVIQSALLFMIYLMCFSKQLIFTKNVVLTTLLLIYNFVLIYLITFGTD